MGNEFFILLKGVVLIRKKNFSKIIRIAGVYFGETALLTDNHIRTTNITALTPVEVLIVQKHDFNFIFEGNNKVHIK